MDFSLGLAPARPAAGQSGWPVLRYLGPYIQDRPGAQWQAPAAPFGRDREKPQERLNDSVSRAGGGGDDHGAIPPSAERTILILALLRHEIHDPNPTADERCEKYHRNSVHLHAVYVFVPVLAARVLGEIVDRRMFACKVREGLHLHGRPVAWPELDNAAVIFRLLWRRTGHGLAVNWQFSVHVFYHARRNGRPVFAGRV
jgi:hypothetical protein